MASTPLRIRMLADASRGERLVRYLARGDAVKPLEDGSYLIDPDALERILWNPDTVEDVHDPWPLAGVVIEGAVPKETAISQRLVVRGEAEGWIRVVGKDVQSVPAGPTSAAPPPHTLMKADELVFDTIHGRVRYVVTHAPGKYPDRGEASGYRVDHFYRLKLVSGGGA